MTNRPHVLIEKGGLVFDTGRGRTYWASHESDAGHVIAPGAAPLVEIIASGHFVLPLLPATPGFFNVFTLQRPPGGRGGGGLERMRRTPAMAPGRLRDLCLLVDDLGGVYASLVYDAARGRFGAGMNAGSGKRELRMFFLKRLTPGEVAGRVLRFVIFVRHDVLYASVDAIWDGPEISAFGYGPSTGRLLHPWRAPPEGKWSATSGEVPGGDYLAFPPGFGLADVRVSLRGHPRDDDELAAYSGALDHLALPSPQAATSEDGIEEWSYGF